jgi:hypothetical protein
VPFEKKKPVYNRRASSGFGASFRRAARLWRKAFAPVIRAAKTRHERIRQVGIIRQLYFSFGVVVVESGLQLAWGAKLPASFLDMKPTC